MDKYLEIELDSWGFTFSTAQVYFSLSWLGLGIVALGVIAYKVYKHYKADTPLIRI